MSYVISVGGDPLNPNPFTYSQISMTEAIELIWPSNTADATYTATNWIDVTASGACTITMPPANEASEGAEVVFNNYGSNTITINGYTGSNITTVASGETKRIWITDNSTEAGTWRVANIGSGTTQADASMLAGYGLIAQSGLLSQSLPPLSYSTDAILNAGARAALVRWTSGAGTFILDDPATLGSNWFTNIKNSGSGTLNIDANGAQIDGTTDIDVPPESGFTIGTDGVAFYTIGRIIPETSGFTLLSKAVGGNTDVTLTSAEAGYSIIYFTGVLTGNINIIVPATVNEWIMFNNTSGAFTLTVKTSGGTGVAITQGTRRILNCDGTDVNFSDTVGSGSVTSVGTGTGLSGGPITTTGTISISNTGVAAGSYNLLNAAVNAQGQITSAASATSAVLQQLRAPTSLGSTLEIQAYTGTTYTSLATFTSNATPTLNLASAATIGNAYIYRVGGTDVAVTDGGTGSSTLTENNIILGNGTSAVQFLAPGTSGYVATSNGTTWTSQAIPSPINLGTAQATTSGTQKTFSAIPSFAKKVNVMFSGVSTTGSSPLIIQLGTSGGIVTTGYLGGANDFNSTPGGALYTNGLGIGNSGSAAYLINGKSEFCLLNGNTWAGNGVFANSAAERVFLGATSVPLGATLTQVRVTTSGGTDTFDAGIINISYE